MSKKKSSEILTALDEHIQDHKKIAREVRDLLTRICSIFKKYDSHFIECKKSLKSQEAYLRENNKLNQMVDESLSNLLLAINQNEYLKAWYPEQLGYPAMKVVGRHPAKTASAKLK